MCVWVNATIVMNAWRASQQAEGLRFLPDGNGDVSRANIRSGRDDACGGGMRGVRRVVESPRAVVMRGVKPGTFAL